MQDTDVTVARAQFDHAIAILIGKPPAELTIPPSPLNAQPPVIPGALPSELLERPSRFWAVGPQLTQTLFDGGRRRATSETALANYDGTAATYRQTTLTAFQEA